VDVYQAGGNDVALGLDAFFCGRGRQARPDGENPAALDQDIGLLEHLERSDDSSSADSDAHFTDLL
jgi:hypothetical protein